MAFSDKRFLIKKKSDLVPCHIHPHKTMCTKLFAVGYPYVKNYIPPTCNSIAIEPMTCIPDAFNNQTGLKILPSGSRLHLKVRISVEKTIAL